MSDATSTPQLGPATAAANRLTRQWVEKLDGGDHVLSGGGAWMVLAALLAGAEGVARSELEAALGVGRSHAARAASALGELIEQTEGTSSAVAMWVRPELEIRPEYRDGLGEAVRSGPMPSQADADAWVAEATDGLLDRCPIDLTPQTVLALIGVVTALGDWERRFTPTSMLWGGGDRVDAVTRTDPDSAAADLLDGDGGPVSRVRLTTAEGFEVHLLGGDATAAATGVLARGIDAVDGVVVTRPGADLAVGESAGMLRAERAPGGPREQGSLVITAPTFTVREHHDLLAQAGLFGLEAASDPDRAHFPLISDTPLAVDAAAQDAVAELSATGFRAAAATAVGMVRTGAMLPPDTEIDRLVAAHDRPFGFLVVEPVDRLVLFAGWVASP